MRNEIFLLLPLLCWGIYVNFFFNMQIGIRYILFFYPLLYVFAGNLCVGWDKFRVSLKAMAAVLLVYLALSTLSYAPHFISYFNEIVWDRKQAYKFLADSNLEWGGLGWYADRYIKGHPDTIYEPLLPTQGRIMVPGNSLVGIWDPERFRWLRENYQPVDEVAYGLLIYDIPPEGKVKSGGN